MPRTWTKLFIIILILGLAFLHQFSTTILLILIPVFIYNFYQTNRYQPNLKRRLAYFTMGALVTTLGVLTKLIIVGLLISLVCFGFAEQSTQQKS